MKDLASVTAFLLCLCAVVAAAGAEKVAELPYPRPRPDFDHSKIDRTLTEPSCASAKPAYRFFAFGPEGKSIITMVADESNGTRTGYDILYVDVDADHDLTDPGERFPLNETNPAKPHDAGSRVIFRLAAWGVTVVPPRQLTISDPKFDYTLTAGSGFVLVTTTLKDGSWAFPMRIMDDSVPWSLDKSTAPVIRFGGNEFTLANLSFARRDGELVDAGNTIKTVRPGDNIYVDGTAPFFYGSSPDVSLGRQGGVYCPWTDRNISAWVESTEQGGRLLTRIPFQKSCGGAYWGSILVNSAYPHGKATLVIAMDTRGYLGTIVERIPFSVDNPRYGKPIEELPMTNRLRADNPGATVLEIYQGAALPELGVPEYDGARDVYFGDYGANKPHGQSCRNRGVGLSYGYETRYDLHLGGEARRSLIKFDLSMLARETKVKQAVLALYVREVNKQVNLDCRAFALKKRWNEKYAGFLGGLNESTSLNPQGGRWTYPVGAIENWEERMFKGQSDRHAEPVGALSFEDTGWAEVDVTPAVQNRISSQWPNHGLALEMVEERHVNGALDVLIFSSDYAVDPALRPRLILAIEGQPKARPYRTTPVSADLNAATSTAQADGKLVLCNVLSSGSLTSRAFETRVLDGVPALSEYIDAHFIEVRIDGADPKHKKLLQKYGVRRFPTALVLSPKGPDYDFAIIEPFDWDAMFGIPRSSFEFEQTFSKELERVLDRATTDDGRLRPGGTEVGGAGCGIIGL